MKKIAENALALLLILAFMVGASETPSGGLDLAWTGGWFMVVLVCAILLNRLDRCSTKNTSKNGKVH